MTEYARDYSDTSPSDVPEPPPPPPSETEAERSPPAPPEPATTCTLCDAPIVAGAQRCASCGLWAGGYGEPVSRPTLVRVGTAFAVLYVVALVLVALAR